MPAVPLSRWSQQIGGVSVNFTVGRIVSRKGKPGGDSPSLPATGQHLSTSANSSIDPSAGSHCGGVGPRDCPAAVLSFHHGGTNA